jgi:hypothetical protein
MEKSVGSYPTKEEANTIFRLLYDYMVKNGIDERTAQIAANEEVNNVLFRAIQKARFIKGQLR